MTERQGAITFQGNPLTLLGNEIEVGSQAPEVELLANDLSPVKVSSFKGSVLILVTVPSLDTPVCDMEVKRFNKEAASLSEDVTIAAVSMDLPFAQARWCGAGGVDRVQTLSDHREAALGMSFGLLIKELRLLARAVLVIDREGVVQYVQIVKEVTEEPDYAPVLGAVKKLV